MTLITSLEKVCRSFLIFHFLTTTGLKPNCQSRMVAWVFVRSLCWYHLPAAGGQFHHYLLNNNIWRSMSRTNIHQPRNRSAYIALMPNNQMVTHGEREKASSGMQRRQTPKSPHISMVHRRHLERQTKILETYSQIHLLTGSGENTQSNEQRKRSNTHGWAVGCVVKVLARGSEGCRFNTRIHQLFMLRRWS